MSEIIDLGDRNLAVENLGEMWQDFAARLMPEAAILFKDAYNLISISLPENGNDIQITNILIDESLETSDTVMHIRKLLIDSIVDCLQMMGIIIDYDYVSPDSLKDLVHILDTIYTLDGMDDLMQLVEILDDELIDAKERFIRVIERVEPDYDLENFPYMIKEVSPNVTKGILIGLNILDNDDTEYMEPTIKRRVQANKEFLKETLAWEHITKGGASTLSLEVLMTLFVSDLGIKLTEDKLDYFKQVLSLMLISDLTDGQIKSQYFALLEEVAENMDEIYKAQTLLEKVKLDEQV
ncbi:hypothetical protein PQC65_gp098 [Aeromonas phage pAEv1810]|uniref:hypothetical protein n=1 Tax=Aeromonas phage pAEv1810 TaxID=2908744 RepID=UPI0023295E59|nr:hypothetical protein PQC65_gp098 [Aeromonas phage pAEv1810]UIS25036.1 hypothetical protein pAEv1810_98 [Aeromonas phage pAEv1810]WAX22321.1 hypothetical protein AVP1_0211 [Aeromonas phage AVP1]